MDIILKEIAAAASGGLPFLAVQGALSIPDICSALETDEPMKPGTVGVRYAAWFDQYLGGDYRGTLSGADVYYLRCKMLHQGEMQHAKHSATIFFSPMMHRFVSKNCGGVIGTEVGLRPQDFALELVAAAQEWRTQRANDPEVQRRMASLMALYGHSQQNRVPMVR